MGHVASQHIPRRLISI